MSIEIRPRQQAVRRLQALRDVSLDIASGELIGFSALGLRQDHALAHHCRPGTADVGCIHFSGEDTTDDAMRGARNVGFVSSTTRCFRHMTVFENVAFGWRQKRAASMPERGADPQSDGPAQARAAGLAGQRATPRSSQAGGASASLAARADRGAQGAAARRALRRARRQGAQGASSLAARHTAAACHLDRAHDQEGALEVADRVVVINQGKIEQTARRSRSGTIRPARSCMASWVM